MQIIIMQKEKGDMDMIESYKIFMKICFCILMISQLIFISSCSFIPATANSIKSASFTNSKSSASTTINESRSIVNPSSEVIITLIPTTEVTSIPTSSKEVAVKPTTKVTSIPKEYASTLEQARAKVLQYMAGGEYTNNKDTTICALTDKYCGATVVFVGNTEPLTQSMLNNCVISKIREKLKSTDMVCVWNGEAWVFKSENLQAGHRYIVKYSQNGNKTIVENINPSECYWTKIVWDNNIGIGLSDGTRITYEMSGGRYIELENPIMLGTQEQRIKHELLSCYNGICNGQKNPLNLNLTEINRYISTGSDEGLKSFQVIKAQKASFVAITGGQWGLNELYTKSVKAAVVRFDEIDPGIMKEFVEKNGLQFVTYDLKSNPIFLQHPSWVASYWNYDFGRVIQLNINNYTKYLDQYSMDYCVKTMNPTSMELLWEESRGIYILDTMNLDRNGTEIYKKTWILAQLEKYKDKLDPILEYKWIKRDAENGIMRYS